MAAAGNKDEEVVCGMRTTLGDICVQDRQMVAPGSTEAARLPYLGLEQIESQTGRILSHQPAQDASTGIGAAFRFDSRHVLYSKLRPYLNKVHLAREKGICSTDIYVLNPRKKQIQAAFAAYYLRSPVVLAAHGWSGATYGYCLAVA